MAADNNIGQVLNYLFLSGETCFEDPVTKIKSCYEYKDKDDFSSAKSTCSSLKGYVLNILTEAEMIFIRETFKDYDDIWIGLTNHE